MGSRIALALAIAVATFGTVSGVANAAATIQSNADSYTFLPGPYVQGLGEIAIFDNSASPAYHDVTATQTGPDGRPLFFAQALAGGQTGQVKGTQYLTAGTYPFYCQLHGAGMSGELTIDGSSGTVVRRPSVKVSFVRQKLKQVRRVGVRVKVRAATASTGVGITAKKGKVVLGSKRGLSFKTGQTRTLLLPLTKAGRKAIRKGKAVKINLRATVAFGKPSSATRKVR